MFYVCHQNSLHELESDIDSFKGLFIDYDWRKIFYISQIKQNGYRKVTILFVYPKYSEDTILNYSISGISKSGSETVGSVEGSVTGCVGADEGCVDGCVGFAVVLAAGFVELVCGLLV